MCSQKIKLSIQNNIAQIILNYPEKNNILTIELKNDFIEALTECENNPDVRIIMIGSVGKHFCAGADLKHMYDMANAPFEENFADAKKLAHFFYRIYSCKKPTICCANGKTFGGGLGLIAACDIAIASHNANFCFSEVRLGLLPAIISPFILQRMSYQDARYTILTAEVFGAQEADELQLIDHVSDDDPLAFGSWIAESLLKNNQAGMLNAKRWLQTLRPILPAQLDEAAHLLATIRATDEVKQHIKQFLTT